MHYFFWFAQSISPFDIWKKWESKGRSSRPIEIWTQVCLTLSSDDCNLYFQTEEKWNRFYSLQNINQVVLLSFYNWKQRFSFSVAVSTGPTISSVLLLSVKVPRQGRYHSLWQVSRGHTEICTLPLNNPKIKVRTILFMQLIQQLRTVLPAHQLQHLCSEMPLMSVPWPYRCLSRQS